VPVVVNYRGGLAGEFLARSARLVRFTMRRADVLVVPSGFLQKVFSDHRMGSCVVSNIVDLDRFSPRPHSDQRSGRVHVVIARNLEPIYDVATGVRAFARFAQTHPEATMSIAGTGPERGVLESQVRDAGLQERVRFTGRLDRDQMAALYRTADIVLNPTLVDNMPNSVLEAMASGVPVVSTDVGGVPYIVTHEKTALLVPAGNSERMAEALSRLADSTDLSESIRAAALAEVRRYSWPNVRAELLSVYARCLGLQVGRLTAS
jgi:glycosyltransferase involved in cell wall biosynthesis